MDVKALQARLDAFARERGWDVLQNPRNLAIALAGEAGMLLDLFRWLTDAQSHHIESEYKREAAEEAIADLLLHTLRLADKLGIDVERAVAKKLAENDANYPSAPEPAPEPAPAAAPPARAEQPKPVAKETTPKPAEPTKPVAKDAVPKPVEKDVPKPVEPAKPVAKLAAPAPAAEPKLAAAPMKPAPQPPEEKAPAENPLPTWLDGILPARSGTGRKKLSTTAKVTAEPTPPPEPPKAREPAPPPAVAKPPVPPAPPPAPERIEPAPPPVVERIEAAPPPPEAPELASGPASEPLPERYVDLDTDAAKVLAKALAKRVDGARSDDPLLRELHDEVETLRRTLYSPTPKRSWIGDSLKTIQAILEEAATHDVGPVIRADEYIAQIDRLLKP
jgi:NTP pyrophosphatase (non-canonical NTP hydrolase)